MCLIRSPATSNANTVTMRPFCWATRPGWPLTVRSRNVMLPGVRLAISTQARAICSPPSMGCRKVVARPPPSAIAVASGSSRPIRASMFLASHAALKALTMLACWAGDRRQPGAEGFDGVPLLPGHCVPAGVALLDGIFGLGQGAEEPVGQIDQVPPLAHDRVQLRIGSAVSWLG